MSDCKENSLANLFLDISKKLFENFFDYIDNDKYNKLISETVYEIHEKIILMNSGEELEVNYFDFNNPKSLILDILESMLKRTGDGYNFNINSSPDKELLEGALSRISIQLTNGDYNFSPHDDYKFKQIQNSYKLPNKNYDFIYKQSQQNYKKFINKKLNLQMQHKNVYDELVRQGIMIWKDCKNSTLYFKVNPFENNQKTDKAKLSDYLTKLLNRDIEIYDSTNDIKHPEAKKDYLIISLLPMVKMEVFNPSIGWEFQDISNNTLYQNTFEYTTFLKKRHLKPIETVDIKKGIIVQFIKQLSQNEDQFSFIIHWLANFFQNLCSSKACLVLIGDEETTNTFIYDIIKPIFAYRNKYLSIINDKTLQNTNDSLIRDKIFYHISNISTSNTNHKRISNLVLEILSPKYKTTHDAWENHESFINGELIVTSSSDTPYSFLKDSYTRCVVFQVKHLDTILKKMNINRILLKENIFDNLDDFSDILAVYPVDKNYYKIIHTEEKDILSTMKNGILKTKKLNKQIEEFINAIRSNNLNSFVKIEQEDSDLYEEFQYNFQNKMIAQPLLSTYFNIMFDEIIFSDNSIFLEILKEKAPMFKKAPNDKSKYKGKKRYQIV
ncbi:hypothetical protein SJPD1_2682 [Sulfurospirillum diekertiae]|uniref:Uncharacterized protein n=1 Tax=Sulfurospirillum diekertiae TaxID=1854492 RepID=A0A290HHS5_9BACT|nr:hypothetical protein [Sulfurospirillum diekertiae]ATB70771.1 hypothetical protein SJPD1_2682 [Sulfurospirillum diekertiae]